MEKDSTLLPTIAVLFKKRTETVRLLKKAFKLKNALKNQNNSSSKKDYESKKLLQTLEAGRDITLRNLGLNFHIEELGIISQEWHPTIIFLQYQLFLTYIWFNKQWLSLRKILSASSNDFENLDCKIKFIKKLVESEDSGYKLWTPFKKENALSLTEMEAINLVS